MPSRDYEARRIVESGMEILRYRCEARDWQRQLRYARELPWWSFRTRWYPDEHSSQTPPEVLFTSTGVLIDAMARPWRGVGYELLDAHVSDDVSPWIELRFKNRLGREVIQLPVPDGVLKAAMEMTKMLSAKGKPLAEISGTVGKIE